MKTKIRILMAEDDPYDLDLIQFELKRGEFDFTAEVVENKPDYINALHNFDPDIILSDYSFPSFDGESAFILKQSIKPDIPFIFISGIIGEEKAVELIRNGVTDYVLKDKLFSLNPKIKRAFEEFELRRQKLKTDEILRLSEKSLTRAQQLGLMGSWVFTTCGNSLLLSEEACAIYGFDIGQINPSVEHWVSLIHPEDAFAAEKLRESLISRSEFSINCRMVRKTGFVRSIYLEGRPEFDLLGNSIGLYGIVQDVTKSILTEQALAKERRLRQSLITTAVIKAQENERFAIAKELNENLIQTLGAAKMYSELAQTDETKRYALLERSSGYLVSVINSIKKISKSLTAPGTELGLFSCIKNLINDLQNIYPIIIRFYTGNIAEGALNQNLRVNIFRIIQDQLTNIIKHSKADKAVIRLSVQERIITLSIMDDGQGVDVVKDMEGTGLRNIRTRAQLHDGTSNIVSYPDKGFELRVTLSLNDYSDKKLTQK